MAVSSAGLRPKSDCSGKAHDQLYSQRGRYKITKPQLSKENLREKEKLVAGPRWAPDTRTDWPTDCRSKLTSTATSTSTWVVQ
jgi:hypothetical protein